MILKVNGGNGVWISINGGDKSFASGSPGMSRIYTRLKCKVCGMGFSGVGINTIHDEEKYVVTINSRFNGSVSAEEESSSGIVSKCSKCNAFAVKEFKTIYNGGRWG